MVFILAMPRVSCLFPKFGSCIVGISITGQRQHAQMGGKLHSREHDLHVAKGNTEAI